MDLEQVRAVIALAEENGLAELEVVTDALSVRVVRQRAALAQVTTGPLPAAAPTPAAGTNAEPPARLVRSPMAGTFYQAPEPGAAPFVQPGATVASGNVLCIIESMKMMNELKAPAAGTIVEVLVADGTPVETGQPLFSLR